MKSASIKDNTGNSPKTTIKKEVISYINDPFFMKKAKESKEFFDKHSFPKELLQARQK